jgi:hypothetical protein
MPWIKGIANREDETMHGEVLCDYCNEERFEVKGISVYADVKFVCETCDNKHRVMFNRWDMSQIKAREMDVTKIQSDMSMFHSVVACSGGCDKIIDKPGQGNWICDECASKGGGGVRIIEQLLAYANELRNNIADLEKKLRNNTTQNACGYCHDEGIIDGMNRVLYGLEKVIEEVNNE